MKGETYFTPQRNTPCIPQTSTTGMGCQSCDALVCCEYLSMTMNGRQLSHDAEGIFHMIAQRSGRGGTMNDAKCKRGLRVPSASITLVTTRAFSTKGGQVPARQRYYTSSVAQPFSRLRYRQRGQTELKHPCMLNKACALAALHTHTPLGSPLSAVCLPRLSPWVSRSDVSCVGVFGWRPLASSLRWCGAAALLMLHKLC